MLGLPYRPDDAGLQIVDVLQPDLGRCGGFTVARGMWPRWVATGWNVAGILILANVVLHAQLAAPGPYRVFMTEPSTAFLGTFPYIWLPGFLVPLAFWLHAGSLMQLRLRCR